MKRLSVFFSMMAVAGFLALNLNSCSSDDPEPIPEPSIQLLAQVEGHIVTLTVQTTDAESLAWDYGDGNISAQATSHDYEYEFSGDYTISVTATGDGGSATATADITIDPEPAEILAGTPDSHPDGKTWILSTTYYSGKNGAGPITAEMPITLDFMVDNVLEEMLGLGDEYDNEFTFKHDGSLIIDNKNGISLGSYMYSMAVAETGPAAGYEGGQGLCGIQYTPESSGTWELITEDLNMDVIIEDPINLDAGWEPGTLSMAGQMVIVPTDYFGLLGMTKTVIVKEITSEYMHVVFLMHGVADDPFKPSTAIHVTFVPKQ